MNEPLHEMHGNSGKQQELAWMRRWLHEQLGQGPAATISVQWAMGAVSLGQLTPDLLMLFVRQAKEQTLLPKQYFFLARLLEHFSLAMAQPAPGVLACTLSPETTAAAAAIPVPSLFEPPPPWWAQPSRN